MVSLIIKVILCPVFDTFNLHIMNGGIGRDNNVGGFTCHTPREGSIVDYFVASERVHCRSVDTWPNQVF